MSVKKQEGEGVVPVTTSVYLQFQGKELSLDAVLAAVNENYESVKQGADAPEDIKIYLKPEDAKAYYVINNDFAGDVPLQLG